MSLALAILAAVATCAPPNRPLIAEILYDAVGVDTGNEFVELFNPTGGAFPLAGLRLEAGDGAGPGRWTPRWTGVAGDTIAAGGRFVIGGASVLPAPQAIVNLDLQNGPDAVRLVWPDGAIEVVGYGVQEFPEYQCGLAAMDVASGQSLARIPDDSNQGSNELDFRAATPSPGRANQPRRDAALLPGSLALAPELPDPGAAATLSGAVVNLGATMLAAPEVRIVVRTSAAAPADSALATAALDADLAAGDTARFAIPLAPPVGRQWLRAAVAVAADEAPGNDADSLLVRVGPGPLELTEIQFHPASGEGEWVEVRNRSGAPLDLAAFTLADAAGAAGAPGGGTGTLAPDSLAILAEDRAALLGFAPGLDAARVWDVKPWDTLNDRDGADGIADVVHLRERDGPLSDRTAYSAAGAARGVSLERLTDGTWAAGSAAGGTPLAAPRSADPRAPHLSLARRRVAAGGTTRIAWSLPWPRVLIAVELWDLSGRRIAVPLPETEAAGVGYRDWAVAGVPPGLYVIALRASDPTRRESLTESRAFRIGGLAP